MSTVDALRDAFFGSPFAPLDLPALKGRRLDPRAVMATARVHRLAELGAREVREVTVATLLDASARAHALREALETRCFLWVTTATPEERGLLETELPGMVRVLSDDARDDVVLGLHTASLARALLADPDADPAVLGGLDTTHVPRDIVHSLARRHVPLTHVMLGTRLARDPRTWVYVVVFVYSALRALPVMFVPQFHGSVALLWGIDVVTALPYTWGVLAMLTATVPSTRLIGTLVALATFMAPYVYFWSHGRHYPPEVVVVVVGMILLSIGAEVWRAWQERRLRRAWAARV